MMITGREYIFAWYVDESCELAQDSAFMIIGVTESEENRVALIMKLRVATARLLNEINDPIHFLFVFRPKTLQTF